MKKARTIFLLLIFTVLFSTAIVMAEITIQLQEPETETLEDGMFDEDQIRNGDENFLIADAIDGAGEISFIKFNLANIPQNQVIYKSTLCFHTNYPTGASKQNLNVWYVNNQDWKEETIDGLCDGGEACPELYNLFTKLLRNYSGEGHWQHVWHCIEGVEEAVSNAYLNGDNSVSFALENTGPKTGDHYSYSYTWLSKESSDPELRPYLLITYEDANTDLPSDFISFKGPEYTEHLWMGTEGAYDCWCADVTDFSTCDNQMGNMPRDHPEYYVGVNFGGYGLYNGIEWDGHADHRQKILIKFFIDKLWEETNTQLEFVKTITGKNYGLVIDDAHLKLHHRASSLDSGQEGEGPNRFNYNVTLHEMLRNWEVGKGKGPGTGCPHTSGLSEEEYNWTSPKYAIFPTEPWGDYGNDYGGDPANLDGVDRVGIPMDSNIINSDTINLNDCVDDLSQCVEVDYSFTPDLVKHWIAQPETNFGLLLEPTQLNPLSAGSEEQYWTRFSSYESMRPSLDITYHYEPLGCANDADCDNELFCDGAEQCIDEECVSGELVNCFEYNFPEILQCDYSPDDNPFTLDYAPGFVSICDEENDECTSGTRDILHTCDIESCNAECEVDLDCDDSNPGSTDICLNDCSCEHTWNNPPILDAIGDREINENEVLIIDINATDLDGDILTYYTDASFGTFDSDLGLFEWVTTLNDAGEYNITFNVTDGELWDEETITIKVNNVVPDECGDVDASGDINIGDAVYLIAHIIGDGPEPIPYESGDVDLSGTIDIADVIYLIAYIFNGGPAPCEITKK